MRARLLAVVSALAVLVAGCSGGGDEPQLPDAPTVAAAFLAAWSEADLVRAGEQTTDPAAAQAFLRQTNDDLKVTAVRTEVAPSAVTPSVAVGADGVERFRLPYTVTMTLQGLGNWPYGAELPLVKQPSGWKVQWSPSVVHPRLDKDTVLTRETASASGATVLDRAGKPLMEPRPVVTVSIRPDQLKQPAAAYALLGKLGRTPAKAKAEVEAAQPTDTLEQITVREPVFRPFADQARQVGLVTRESERSLAATPDFGRAILNAVVDSDAAAGGSAGGEIQIVPRDGAAETGTQVLYSFKGAEAPRIPTTLDPAMQRAAEAALATVENRASAIVAIDARNGEVRAAANREAGTAATAFNRAFVGQYAPGSTFKIVTSAALLKNGLTIDKQVPCPREAVVLGKSFQNVDEFSLGNVPFRTDFAQSCNTAFVNLAKDLPDSALPEAATTLGFGREVSAGAPVFSGSVAEFSDDVEKVAAAIGQGKVLASPLTMAGVAAAVASGSYRAPVVRTDAEKKPAEPLAKNVGPALKTLMRGVVTDGSARGALGGLSGTVGAKTGTAEFGGGDGGTHAWIVGFRDQLAFAVLIENGGAGGRDAGPVAREFLDRVAG